MNAYGFAIGTLIDHSTFLHVGKHRSDARLTPENPEYKPRHAA